MFLPVSDEVWQWYNMWPCVDSKFCSISMQNMWDISLHVPVCWMLSERQSWRARLQHVQVHFQVVWGEFNLPFNWLTLCECRSQAGGACDCGDTSVMKEAGFCERHGPRAQVGKPTLPPELLSVSQAVMPRIILRLIQHLRSHRFVVKIFS